MPYTARHHTDGRVTINRKHFYFHIWQCGPAWCEFDTTVPLNEFDKYRWLVEFRIHICETKECECFEQVARKKNVIAEATKTSATDFGRYKKLNATKWCLGFAAKTNARILLYYFKNKWKSTRLSRLVIWCANNVLLMVRYVRCSHTNLIVVDGHYKLQ